MKKLLLFSAGILATILTFAQWEPDVRPTYDPNTSETCWSSAVHAIASSGDSIHIVWGDDRDGNKEIYYKRSIDGGLTWGTDIRLTNRVLESHWPAIAISGSIVHVAWLDYPEAGWGRDIFYKRSSDGGNTWGDDIRLTYSTSFPHTPCMVASGDLVHMVYWYGDMNSWYDIYYLRSIDNGLTWEPEVRLTNDPAFSTYPSICTNGSVLHVAWIDKRDGNYYEEYYKRSEDNGVTWGNDTRLTYDDSSSSVASCGVSGTDVHIVWYDNRDGNWEIYYKRSTDGGLNWEADTRLTNDPNTSKYSNIAVSGSGVFVIWIDDREGEPEIYYKCSTDGGVNWGPDIRLTYYAQLISMFASYISISGDQLNVVWTDERDGNYEVYYKRDPTAGALMADFEADPTTVCTNDSVQFTDLSSWNPTQWQWTFPGGDPGTSTLQNPVVTYNTAGNYDVSLFASNDNMNDFITRNDYIHVFDDTLSAPATPTGNDILCQGSPPVQYSTTGSPGATSYLWQIDPANAGEVTGIESTVMIYWDYAFTGVAQVTVKAVNICTESGFSPPLPVLINPLPFLYNVTGGGTMCEGASGLEIGLEDSDTGIEYELFRNGVTTDSIKMGTGSAISFGIFALPGVYTATGKDTSTLCECLMSGGVFLSVVSFPLAPAAPQGPDSVNIYFTPSTEYFTQGSAGSVAYEWLLEPGNAGTLVQPDTLIALITWDPAFQGIVGLQTRGNNECGPGEWSDPLSIYVQYSVGTNETGDHSSVIIYPNPNHGTFTIAFPGWKSGPVSVHMVNLLGQTIYRNEMTLSAGNQQILVDPQNCLPGIYNLMILDGSGISSYKIIVRKE